MKCTQHTCTFKKLERIFIYLENTRQDLADLDLSYSQLIHRSDAIDAAKAIIVEKQNEFVDNN